MKKVDLYYRVSKLGRIGMIKPAVDTSIPDGISLSIKIKPPKFPKKSKKIYKDYFIRKMKSFTHIYDIKNNLYIVSLITGKTDPIEWIDRNENKIKERICKAMKY